MRIGIDLGGTKIEGIVIDDNGIELGRERIATPAGSYALTLEAIAGLVRRLELPLGTQGSVGVGMPGAISAATGLVKNANSTWLIGHPLDRDLSDRLGREVRVANDANCLAVSEAVDGAGADGRVVFAAILGTGVGAGIAIDGRTWPGANAIAGEWGHNPLPAPDDDERPGPACYCGRNGCIETWLSGPALEAEAFRVLGRRLRATEVAAAASQDTRAAGVIERYCERLARALAGVINILDPDIVVLGGGLSRIPQLYACVPDLWRKHIFSDQRDIVTRLRPARHGDSSGVRGAAWLWPPSR